MWRGGGGGGGAERGVRGGGGVVINISEYHLLKILPSMLSVNQLYL